MPAAPTLLCQSLTFAESITFDSLFLNVPQSAEHLERAYSLKNLLSETVTISTNRMAYQTEEGITIMNVYDFLMNTNSLNV